MKKTRLATTQTLPRSAGTSSEGYLDKVAIAQRLGVKPRTVAEWANKGKLPAYRLGPYLRFKWAEVEQYLAAKARVCPPTETTPQPSPRSHEARLPRKEISETHRIRH